LTEAIGRVVIVTGAASGIGSAIARTIAGPKTDLVLHTRKNEDGLARVLDACRAAGSCSEGRLGDLAEPDTAAALVGFARERFGRVDQIVSNAGQAARSRFGDLGPEQLDDAFQSMPMAFLRLVTAGLDDLKRSGWGRVVAVSSFVAHGFGTADFHFPATGAAKAALEALVRSLAVQLADTGTTANIVVPGFTRKDAGGHRAVASQLLAQAVATTPTGRLTEPTDVAAAVRFLLGRESGQITGQALHVDGGLLLP